MKKLFLIVFSLIMLFSNQSVLAHSGRTDSSGGHNCSAKSKSKGLCSGYHYHNSGSSSNSSSSSSSSNGSTSTTTKNDNSNLEYVDITLIVNDKAIKLDQKPVLINGTTLIPLRNIFVGIGASLQWDQQSKKITAIKGDITIELIVGSNNAKKNNKVLVLKEKPIVINGFTMVPARFAAESLGATVDWNSETKTITITY